MLHGAFVASYSIWQYEKILATVQPVETPSGYSLGAGMVVNAIIGTLGIAVSVYLARSFVQMLQQTSVGRACMSILHRRFRSGCVRGFEKRNTREVVS